MSRLGALCIAFLLFTGSSHGQTGVQATYNQRGLVTLTYNGVTLVDIAPHSNDGFSVEDYNLGGTAGWGGIGNTISWDDTNKRLTWSYIWGRVDCQYAIPAGTNNFVVTLSVTNSSTQILNGINIYPFGVRFPSFPPSFVDPNYPQTHNNLDGPVLIPADYKTGMVLLADEDAQPLFLGFSPAPPTNHYRLRVGTLGNGNDSFLTKAVPVNRPVLPGQSHTYKFSLRFAPSGTDYHTIAGDVLTTFGQTWPSTLTWPDRRPIGELFTSVPTNSPRPDSDPNPRGYWFGPNIDIRTPAGLATFQQMALSYADKSVTILKDMNAQGAIVWDLEGQQYPHETSYIGDPSLLPKLAPETDGVADAFFKKFRDAGLRVGVTIRPQRLVLAGSNTYQDWANMTDPGGVMLQKMRYAHDRWGCTLFYVDSDGGPNDSLDPAIFKMLAQALPDSLIIPENIWTKDFAYTAPLASFWAPYKPLHTPPDVQAMWPTPFMVTYIGDPPGGTLMPLYNELVQAVRQGGILSFRGWFDDQPLNGQVKQIYLDAGQVPTTVSVVPTTAVLSANQQQQFTATVTGMTNAAVSWSILSGGPGSISPSGRYTAPASISSQQTVTIQATSAADPTKSGTATITLSAGLGVTVTSSPAGLALTVDGGACTAPCTFQWAPGATHTIGVTATPQSGATGTQYLYANWSDGGAQSHSITAPSAPTTYTANFTIQYYLTTTAATGGTINPVSGWYNSGAVVAVSATANSGYHFTGFSGALSGTTTPQNLTINAPPTVTANFSASALGVTVTSSPAGLSLTVDGSACTVPCTFQWTPGATHTIGVATTPQSGATGTQYLYANWSDGGAQSHSITAPSAPTTYTANFTTQYYLTTTAATGGTINPVSGWYNSGAVVAVSATANSGYQFTGFGGALSGTTTPQNLTMSAPAAVTANFALNLGSRYSNYRTITVLHGQVSGNQSNFPVLLNLTAAGSGTISDLATVANGGKIQNTTAVNSRTVPADLVFSSDTVGANLLHWEIESYNPATGDLVAWVQTPSLSGTQDTSFYVVYGSGSVTSWQGNVSGTWDSNYVGVWHLADSAANRNVLDSTSRRNNLTNQVNTSLKSTSGPIAGALSYNGFSDFSNISAAQNGLGMTGTITLQAWVNFNSLPSQGNNITIMGKGYNDSTKAYSLDIINPAFLPTLTVGSTNFPDFYGTRYEVSSFTGIWHHVVGTWDGSSWRLYVDGANVATTPSTKGPIANGEQFVIGGQDSSGNVQNLMNGSLDEVRVSNIARSAGWITTEFNNQSKPANFYTVAPGFGSSTVVKH